MIMTLNGQDRVALLVDVQVRGILTLCLEMDSLKLWVSRGHFWFMDTSILMQEPYAFIELRITPRASPVSITDKNQKPAIP